MNVHCSVVWFTLNSLISVVILIAPMSGPKEYHGEHGPEALRVVGQALHDPVLVMVAHVPVGRRTLGQRYTNNKTWKQSSCKSAGRCSPWLGQKDKQNNKQ